MNDKTSRNLSKPRESPKAFLESLPEEQKFFLTSLSPRECCALLDYLNKEKGTKKMKKIKTKKRAYICTCVDSWCVKQSIVGVNSDICKEKHYQETTLTFSIPLNKVIKTGQPILVGSFKVLRLFSHFDEDDYLYTFGGTTCTETIFWGSLEWTLLTHEELKKIGHADLGWLTAEDLEDDHSEE